ncbi:DUF3800 domain-containing protein [Salinispora vitiensis]|uniref:DUF3800 domain-containing protein n=1 Tax=Salinispora vitiensis TaxID=999544 RepID=UPI00035D4395|nr:DUF3800 domain-containing protein [Salinispora vitiensis]
MARRFLFSDESGDLNFKKGPNLSRFFAVGTLAIDESELSGLRAAFGHLRDELAFRNHGLDSCFHATNDTPEVRLNVFKLLSTLDFQFDITLLEKSKAQPHVRQDHATFFRYAWYYHLKYVAPRTFGADDEALIVAAELGTKRTRKAFRGGIEAVLTQCLPYRVKRTLAFWPCSSDFALQAADYCTWAVTRLRERDDGQYYEIIQPKIRHVYDLWASGTTHYY